MKILLDENFPLALVRELQRQGCGVEHIIFLGLHGAPDSVIVNRLNAEDLLFLTQDQEFLNLPLTPLDGHSLTSNPKLADRRPSRDLARCNLGLLPAFCSALKRGLSLCASQ